MPEAHLKAKVVSNNSTVRMQPDKKSCLHALMFEIQLKHSPIVINNAETSYLTSAAQHASNVIMKQTTTTRY